jgi:hypothetical protein
LRLDSRQEPTDIHPRIVIQRLHHGLQGCSESRRRWYHEGLDSKSTNGAVVAQTSGKHFLPIALSINLGHPVAFDRNKPSNLSASGSASAARSQSILSAPMESPSTHASAGPRPVAKTLSPTTTQSPARPATLPTTRTGSATSAATTLACPS